MRTKIYRVNTEGALQEIKTIKLDFEERIQNWVEKDVNIISDNLLVIGREVETAYGGFIDILCIDGQGDIVIIELKRDMTPREVTAQTLDYASWVSGLSHDEITRIADDYFDEEDSLSSRFPEKFGFDVPDTLNTEHRMIVVGSRIDAGTERIIHYLSENYGVGINAVTFTFHESDGQEYLSRNSIIEETEASAQASKSSRSKRQRNLSIREFLDIAEAKGVASLFEKALDEFSKVFSGRSTSRSTVTFTHDFDGHRNSVLALEPHKSSEETGLAFYIHRGRVSELFNNLDGYPEELLGTPMITENNPHYSDSILCGCLSESNQIERLAAELAERRKW